MPFGFCYFKPQLLPLRDLQQLPGCQLIQGDYGWERLWVHGGSRGIRSPRQPGAHGVSTALRAEIAVPLALQNHPHCVQGHDSVVALWASCLYLGRMEFL